MWTTHLSSTCLLNLKILFVFILTPFRYTRAHAQVLHAQRSQ